jgi:RNA polymerase sigma-70 factor, ECF subfamily
MGSSDRFSALYQRHYRSVWAFVVRRIPVGVDAGDVVAEVFATAWRRLDRVPEEPDTLLWLYATAGRTAANQVRSARRRYRLRGRLAGLRDSHEPVAGPAAGEHAEVLAALDRLRPLDREAIRLAIWEDLPVQDIATVLGCSPNAVSLRLRRAREGLRTQLAPLLAGGSPPTGERAETGGHDAGHR